MNNSADTDSEDELPVGWEENITKFGTIHYYNRLTNVTQKQHPRTGKIRCIPRELPFGWEEINRNGNICFVEKSKNFVTNIDPRLAFVFDKKKDPFDIAFKFDAYSTAFDVLHGSNLSGKIAVVTGANSGIGFETVRSLAFHGCCVILACRTLRKAEKAVEKLKVEKSYVNCIPMEVDLASLKSVKRFADLFKSRFKSLNMLILNAAVFMVPYRLTEDNYESTFQICHLGHYYMTILLQDIILKSYPARIVIVSCESHRFSNLTADNLMDAILVTTDKYSRTQAYANAKLCNLLFANELHTRLNNKGVEVFAVHPGNLICTNIHKYCWITSFLSIIFKPFTKTLQQAASTSVFCATAYCLENASGIYFNNCFPCPPDDRCKDRLLAQKLWLLSKSMIKLYKKRESAENTYFRRNSAHA